MRRGSGGVGVGQFGSFVALLFFLFSDATLEMPAALGGDTLSASAGEFLGILGVASVGIGVALFEFIATGGVVAIDDDDDDDDDGSSCVLNFPPLSEGDLKMEALAAS